MLRFLAAVVLRLLANAAGVALAAWLLDGFSVTTAAFIGVVILFTLIEVVLDPLVLKLSLQYVPALRGGVALVTTLVGLIVTTIVSDGLVIEGLTAWVVGTLIVWLGGVLAALLLPLFIFKSVRGAAPADRPVARRTRRRRTPGGGARRASRRPRFPAQPRAAALGVLRVRARAGAGAPRAGAAGGCAARRR